MDLGTSPADFAGLNDIITTLAKEGEPGIEIIEHTPLSLIITGKIRGLWREKN